MSLSFTRAHVADALAATVYTAALVVFKALRAELAALRAVDDLPYEAPERRAVLDVFYPDDAEWRRTVLQRGGTVLDQSLAFLVERRNQ